MTDKITALYRADGDGSPPRVGLLAKPVPPVVTTDLCVAVLDVMLANPDLYALPVVTPDQVPCALLDRTQYIEFFSRLYSREVYARKKLKNLLEGDAHFPREAPIVVDESCSIDDISNIIINAGMRHMVTGFVVTREGRYLGIGSGRDLLDMVTRHSQERLFHLAHYDSLTGLPNRVLLQDRLAQALREAERQKSMLALVYVDVDRFKQINDTWGHSAGDALLRIVAERLTACSRQSDTVARLGGDEFVVLMENIEGAEAVECVAARLVDAMQTPVELQGHSVVVTISVGYALYPQDGSDSSPLLAKADAAMYVAKSGGRNRFQRFSADTASYNPDDKLLENELRHAIENNQLILHYQPQVRLCDGRLSGAEALVRWQHPQRGLVPPGEFIPIAEASGLIVSIGEWVLNEAFRQMRAWREQGLSVPRLSVNIASLQFQQDSFIPFLETLVAENPDIDPASIELELTETMLAKNIERVLRTIHGIKALGFKLGIDDFGTGFSSLSYLSRFPIDHLKIDKSFVRGIETSPANEAIARAIVAMAGSLSFGIIAEGIENRAELAVLASIQCIEGQGYLFARPMPGDDISAWCEHHRARPAAQAIPPAQPMLQFAT